LGLIDPGHFFFGPTFFMGITEPIGMVFLGQCFESGLHQFRFGIRRELKLGIWIEA